LIDRVKIYVKAGDGGNGVVSFRREKFVPLGGPDGGDGGDGGGVYLMGDHSTSTLVSFTYPKQFKARRGVHGKGKNMHGRTGEDIVLTVPLGTEVRRLDIGEEEGPAWVGEVVEDRQQLLVAKGGKGGRGNARFATPTNQAPRTAESGLPGEEYWLMLDLKLIADAGIIGCPNAGKSTLIRAVSRATPKVADYPFTTLEPALGVVEVGYESFVLADIPGLIEGAHEGHGLGLDFLRHIERTRALIQLVDGSADKPLEDLADVESEMASYRTALMEKPRVVVVNKIDLEEVRERLPDLKRAFKGIGLPVYFISAATGEGVEDLMNKVLELVSRAGRDALPGKEQAEFKVFRPRPVSPRKAARRRGDNE
jgi:GTP-binding protein